MLDPNISTSIIGLVVEFVVAIDEARVRFTDDAQTTSFFLPIILLLMPIDFIFIL